jgi:hypothetical protein
VDPITAFLDEHGVTYVTEGESSLVTHGWIGCVCCFCGVGTGRPGLGINLNSGACSCWKCGSHSLADVLRELTRRSLRTCIDFAKRFRGARVGRDLRPRGRLELPSGLPHTDWPSGLTPAEAGLLPIHCEYLRSRGFDPQEMVRLWHLRGIGIHEKLSWRLFIPVFHDGKAVSWTTRAVGNVDHGKRYWSAKAEQEELPHKELLYGMDYCRNAVIVHEGCTDAWNTGPGAVATFGVKTTEAQVRAIATFPLRVICFDSEPEAQIRAGRMCEALWCLPGRTERVELDSKDAGSAPKKEIALLRKLYLE